MKWFKSMVISVNDWSETIEFGENLPAIFLWTATILSGIAAFSATFPLVIVLLVPTTMLFVVACQITADTFHCQDQ
ncbi:MAG: hypothetical protein UT24_C0030G0018 [Candidatus Woesebacteria bacterium GW2011_GWB1_39_12]|uniref:Uncharacterized protein n=1 Tax=Candidatus Woesebacteria bacterium GW2011_GWB1_39_12 TaxID=1618574 RepID=A0A0G0MF15_9BACT|nr:MAG: hypothetical protein UT24_C0030G0018 [Candidatus Woesebacteria bacterium GW2011_GWB1_39_12]